MDDEEFEFEDVMPSFPFSWRATAAVAGNCAAVVLRAVADLASGVADQIAADHNYRVDQRLFQEEAALEIETLTQQGE